MAFIIDQDVTSVSIRLKELKNKFDQCMRNGENFGTVRKIYREIREMECFLNALTWDPRSPHSSRHSL